MTFTDLPGRGERSAPSFDGGAEELGRYFAELEALYTRHNVDDEQEKKQGTLKYLTTAALERTWRSSDTLADQTTDFDDFKEEMFELYPGSSDDVFTIHHLDTLVGQRTWLGVQNATELGHFHLEFRTISKYLISKNRLSQAEQTRGFLRGLQPELENKVKQRLQITKPQHNPQDPYNLKDLFDAASFCLLRSASTGTTSTTGTIPSLAQPDDIKTEFQAMKTVMLEMTEMFKNVLAAQVQPAAGQSGQQLQNRAPPMARPSSDMGPKCNFCGVQGHFMRECEIVNEYICLGKCKCSIEGKVVLPSRATVPRSIIGAWLRECVDKYHRQNPNQLGAAQMLCEVANSVTIAALSIAEPEAPLGGKVVRFEPEIGQPGVYALKKSTSSKAKGKAPQEDPNLRIVEIHSEDDSEAEPAQFTREFPPHMPQPPDSETDTLVVKHPFAKPSRKDPLDGPEEELTPQHKPECAYTTTTHIYDEKVAQKVFKQILDAQVSITQRELLSLAPEIRAKVAEATV
jgi:hypothetical protein